MEFNPNATAAYLTGKIDEYVKFGGRDTLQKNASRDPAARYARIPDGGACDFCRMLGSRGFVYHTEETAGGDGNDYHPHCNCQIAVTFQPDMLFYEKNGVRVSRGYQGSETYVVKTGRDGSDKLRKVDIDELYEEYLAMGQSFQSTSSYRSYPSHTALTQPEFDAAMKMLEDADTLEELHDAGARIVDQWKMKSKGGALDDDQWRELSKRARELEAQLTEREKQAQAPQAAALIERDFKPLASIEDASGYAENFVDTSAFKSKIDLKGMNIDAANSMMKVLDTVYDAYDLDKLRSIQRMNKRSIQFKGTTADAAYQWLQGDLFYNADYVKTAKAAAAHKAETMSLLDEIFSGDIDGYIAKQTNNRVIRYAEALRDTKRPIVAVDSSDDFQELVYAHEAGHLLDDQIFRKDETFDRKASYAKYSGGISAYATQDVREYMAESFTLYYMGNTEALDPDLVDLFERSKK